MDKEEFYELMQRFIKHCKKYGDDTYEWVVEDMDANGMFEIYGENLKEKFEEMF